MEPERYRSAGAGAPVACSPSCGQGRDGISARGTRYRCRAMTTATDAPRPAVSRPSRAFLREAGIVVVERFFDDQRCDALRRAIDAGEQREAGLWHGSTWGVRPGARRSTQTTVAADVRDAFDDAMRSLLPRIASEMRVEITTVRSSAFLLYREGDFFAAHTDSGAAIEETRRRRVTVLTFLNEPAARPGAHTYSGGALVLCGLKPPPFHRMGFEVTPSTGTIVAFPSDMVHAVQPVTGGRRYTVATWMD